MRHFIPVLVMLFLLPLNAFSEENIRSIQVNGRSTITANAEFATIHAELKVITSSVEESYAAVTKSLTDIAAALKPHGISRENLVTSTISQGTEYGWQDRTRTVIGYYSSCTLNIKIVNIGDTFRIHAALAEFPQLMTGTTQYGRNDESQMQITALQQALKDAQNKARAMADTLGAELGQVLHIREASEAAPFHPARMEAQLAAAPVDPGEVTTTGTITVTGNVSAEFALK